MKRKAVKISETDYGILKRAREEMMKIGLNSLPEEFVSNPEVKGLLTNVEEALSLGGFIRLSQMALIYLLTVEGPR